MTSSTDKAIIVSAPSGAGKSTLVHHLTNHYPQLAFSVSACTRPRRKEEKEGIDYYFISPETFTKHVESDDFIEWEEVYPGCRYGTLKSEIDRIWRQKQTPIFDVDVKGGLNLKKYFGEKGLSVFVQPPSVQHLKERLEKRCTDSPERIAERVAKAEEELGFISSFDTVIVNDDLEKAKREITLATGTFLGINQP